MAFKTDERIELAETGLGVLAVFRGRLGKLLERHQRNLDKQDIEQIEKMIDELQKIKAALVALRNECYQHDSGAR